MRTLEHFIESLIFASRWLLAPFFIGLILAIGVLLVKFVMSFRELIGFVMEGSTDSIVASILTMVDISLIASLLLIIAYSGYENFVSKIGVADHEDRPAWSGKVGFSDLKLKLMGAIVAISAVELLKAFMQSDTLTDRQLLWKLALHVTFVVSGVLFALTEYISDLKKQ